MKKYIIFFVILCVVMLLDEVRMYESDPFVDPLLFRFFRLFEEEPICKEVIHNIKIPSFTAEQDSIIDKYRSIISSKLRHPDTYFFYSAEKLPDKTYMLRLLPFEQLQSYYQIGNCGRIIDVEAELDFSWFLFDSSGEIVKSKYTGRDSLP
jgi:hypothetical protein